MIVRPAIARNEIKIVRAFPWNRPERTSIGCLILIQEIEMISGSLL
jgi:hypothetical protein